MYGKIPHLVQYQGSKRKLAAQIISYMPNKFMRLVEPFSGTAAISLAVAFERRAQTFYLNDLNAPLIAMLRECIEHPDRLVHDYRRVWVKQFEYGDSHTTHFYEVREQFNNGAATPANMLYLLARCVKGAVRYGKNGNFNQSPDRRRRGTTPENIARNAYAMSRLLNGRTYFTAIDYRKVFDNAQPGDVFYMDPPYQGVSDTRDSRYYSGVSFDEFVRSIEVLNQKGVDYLISYDGACGEKHYGESLPESLGCEKILLSAGLSSQTVLLGNPETTIESLYISPSLFACLPTVSAIQPVWEPAV